jgi:Cu(I)/Ag(I) efflux system membrane protein CusA/SilA
VVFVRGRIVPEQRNPLSRLLIWLYRPIIKAVLKAKTFTIVGALAVLGITLWPASRLGSEFMPNLDEGTLFYMPTTLPGISITKAADLLQTQDRIIKSFPEVVSVYGKAGRASTATDPAPTEMFETVINLKPKDQWRAGVTIDSLIAEMDKALQFPGVSNAWTMPIKARIDMLSTGIRTPSASRSSASISRKWNAWRVKSSRCSRPCRARRAPTPSVSSAATISTSPPIAMHSRVMA